jgi:hypothetical protein
VNYTYVCNCCLATITKKRKVADRNNPVACKDKDCNGICTKVMDAPGNVWKTDGAADG